MSGEAGSRREALIEAGIEVLRARGPKAFTMRDVGQAAGVTATAIYRHFRDKEELEEALLARAREQLRAALTRAESESDPLDRLRRSGEEYIEFAIAHPDMYRLMFVEPIVSDLPAFPADFDAAGDVPFGIVVRRVRECMEAGVVGDVDAVETAVSLWALVHGLCMLDQTGRIAPDRFRDVCSRSIDLVLRGLTSPAELDDLR